MRYRPWALVAAATLLTACGAGWRRTEPSPETPLPPRQQVQVWQGDNSRLLHAVVVTVDSISGVPYQLPPDCDSCRVALARSTVDSMRLGNKEKAALKSFGFGYALLGVAAVVLAYSFGRD
jgi:hypothetical protein